ncbi:hypothetical protein [Segetibacter koreensis]|uniref:hypothetical protein n=1 Tax=Segetibacter koreensis TaxID=398037 RepID=UPI0012F88415|nr:hypothetical protein [Segetibacter koreensis]
MAQISYSPKADIISEDYFNDILGRYFINILSEEKTTDYSCGRITREFLSRHIGSINQKFYKISVLIALGIPTFYTCIHHFNQVVHFSTERQDLYVRLYSI